MGRGVGGSSEAPWGPAREILRAPSGHSRALGTPLHFLTLGRGAGGSSLRATAGMESALGSPVDSPSWPFCPQRVPFSRCPVDSRHGCGQTRGALPRAKPGAAPTAAARLFISCSGRGVGFPSLGASNAGLAHGNTPPPAFLLSPAARWELALWRRGSRLFSQIGEQTDK